MIQGIAQAARIAGVLQFCTISFAFQSSQSSTAGPLPLDSRPPIRGTAAESRPESTLRIDSSLVLIPVHVTTQSGTTVTNLRKENFALTEDGVPQTITYFSQDDAPVSVGVLLDVSGSMKNKMQKSAEAATALFRYANPEDEFFLVEFNGRPKLSIPFTREWSALAREISHVRPSGLTALLDAIHMGITQMKRAHNSRRALIVLSDGGENFSRRSLRELTDRLIESDVQVYSMSVVDRDFSVKHTREERDGPKLLGQVALDTGGRDFPLLSLEALPGIGVEIARAMRNEYVLGYNPPVANPDGKYHKVALKLAAADDDGKLRAYYRRGYYAPIH